MAQLDDLKVALDAASAKVDSVGVAVNAVAKEVADLLVALQAHPAAPDLAEVIASAQGVSVKLDAVSAALAAVPPAPVG